MTIARAPSLSRSVALATTQPQALLARYNMLLPGVYAWLSTVATFAFARGAPWLARVPATLALFALLAGPWLALERPRLGRLVGVVLFVVLCLLTWLALGSALGVSRIEPLRAALGAVGWSLFALGWGTVREIGHVPENDPRAIVGTPLVPRKQLPRGAAVVFAVALVGAFVPLLLAWRVARPGAALFAHAVALLAAVALLTAGARVAVERGAGRESARPGPRLTAALGPLGLLALLLAAGLVWLLLGSQG